MVYLSFWGHSAHFLDFKCFDTDIRYLLIKEIAITKNVKVYAWTSDWVKEI